MNKFLSVGGDPRDPKKDKTGSAIPPKEKEEDK